MCDIQTDGRMRLLLLYRLVHLPIVNNGEKFTYMILLNYQILLILFYIVQRDFESGINDTK